MAVLWTWTAASRVRDSQVQNYPYKHIRTRNVRRVVEVASRSSWRLKNVTPKYTTKQDFPAIIFSNIPFYWRSSILQGIYFLILLGPWRPRGKDTRNKACIFGVALLKQPRLIRNVESRTDLTPSNIVYCFFSQASKTSKPHWLSCSFCLLLCRSVKPASMKWIRMCKSMMSNTYHVCQFKPFFNNWLSFLWTKKIINFVSRSLATDKRIIPLFSAPPWCRFERTKENKRSVKIGNTYNLHTIHVEICQSFVNTC